MPYMEAMVGSFQSMEAMGALSPPHTATHLANLPALPLEMPRPRPCSEATTTDIGCQLIIYFVLPPQFGQEPRDIRLRLLTNRQQPSEISKIYPLTTRLPICRPASAISEPHLLGRKGLSPRLVPMSMILHVELAR